jgi:hypothetical protein
MKDPPPYSQSVSKDKYHTITHDYIHSKTLVIAAQSILKVSVMQHLFTFESTT